MITATEIAAQEDLRFSQVDAEVDALLDARGEFYAKELAALLVEADPGLWFSHRFALLFLRPWLFAADQRGELVSALRPTPGRYFSRRYYRSAPS